MQIIPLTMLESAGSEFTHKMILTAADIALLTSGTGASIYPGFNEANTFGAGQYVFAAAIVVKTPFTFSGANNGTLVFTVGDATTANRFVASTDLKGTVTYQVGTIANYPFVYTAASQITITATAGTQNINLVNVGELHIYLGICPLPLLDR